MDETINSSADTRVALLGNTKLFTYLRQQANRKTLLSNGDRCSTSSHPQVVVTGKGGGGLIFLKSKNVVAINMQH